jgi:hypothetical protein
MLILSKFCFVFLCCFFVLRSSDFLESNISSKVSSLKILAVRQVHLVKKNKQEKINKLPQELRELVDLYEPLTIFNVIPKLTQARNVSDNPRMQECIQFIKSHPAEICFETSLVSKAPDRAVDVTMKRFNRRFKRLQRLVNNGSNDVVITISEDESQKVFFQYYDRRFDIRFLPCIYCCICCTISLFCALPFAVAWALNKF